MPEPQTFETFDETDSTCIWVDCNVALSGDGSFESPLETITLALSRARPGSTIVLLPGTYTENVSVHISGEQDFPIRIAAYKPLETRIVDNGWFFYDASDWILSGLVFDSTTHHAISCIGNGSRNSFINCSFTNCGTDPDHSATLFFGGADAHCIMIDNCTFIRNQKQLSVHTKKKGVLSAIMVTDGGDKDTPNTHWIIRNSTFEGYDHAIILGSSDTVSGEYGHILDHNTFKNIVKEAIITKCGDTTIERNRFLSCKDSPLVINAHLPCTINQNRFTDCTLGLVVFGRGHSITQNCIIRCKNTPVQFPKPTSPHSLCAENVLLEHNTFIDCGSGTIANICGIEADHQASFIIKDNIIMGKGTPLSYGEETTEEKSTRKPTYRHVNNNGTGPLSIVSEGFVLFTPSFLDSTANNFEQSDPRGAHGFAVDPILFDTPEVIEDSNGQPQEYQLPDADDEDVVTQEDSAPVTTNDDEADASGDSEDEKILYTSNLLNRSLMLFGNEIELEEENEEIEAVKEEDLE